jgi:nucleotide-binding universal stress UspA family protein
MGDRPSVLCPVDFSDASRGALRYAVALAEHVYGVLTVATVDDSLLMAGADAAYGPGWLKPESIKRLQALLLEALDGRAPTVAELNLDVAVGKPAREILRLATFRRADVIVISTHGRSGIRKWLLGSTAERVLRDTTVPVLVTPPQAAAPDSLEAARLSIRRVFVPIDFSDGTTHQVQVASGIAEALGASVVLAHVAEPILAPAGHARFVVPLRREHRLHVQSTLHELLGGLPSAVRPTFVTASGDPAREIARLARLCDADLTVMGLHASVGGGLRMGSVTYRFLCRTHGLVLALPPQPHGEHKTSAHAAQRNEVGVVG